MIDLLPMLPQRAAKPRNKGITMVMDKGLSIAEADNLISVAGHLIDYIKLGFGTSMVSAGVAEKIKRYQQADIKVYVGGTLFEAFYIRKAIDNYKRLVDAFQLNTIEISDGCIKMNHDQKCQLISEFSKNYIVLSEVGSKDTEVVYDESVWIESMHTELQAGSTLVIAEARESGNVGVFNQNHSANDAMIHSLASHINTDKILWEAPIKNQQIGFIKLFGSNVNLGNISPNEIVALETLRLGLRGDTFFDFLPESLQQFKL